MSYRPYGHFVYDHLMGLQSGMSLNIVHRELDSHAVLGELCMLHGCGTPCRICCKAAFAFDSDVGEISDKFEVYFSLKSTRTVLTFEWFFLSVNPYMSYQITRLPKFSCTKVTDITSDIISCSCFHQMFSKYRSFFISKNHVSLNFSISLVISLLTLRDCLLWSACRLLYIVYLSFFFGFFCT